MRTNLYRCFDATGALLYVGISWHTAARFGQHQRRADWWSEVVRIELEHHASRPRAEAAEKTAIRTEVPLYNRAHSVTEPTSPEPGPGEGYWQITNAHFDGRGWQVDLVSPDGVDIGFISSNAGSLAEAVTKALDDAPSLLLEVM